MACLRYCAAIVPACVRESGRAQRANYGEVGLTPIFCSDERDVDELRDVRCVVFCLAAGDWQLARFQAAVNRALEKLKDLPQWLFNPDQVAIPPELASLASLPLGPPRLVERIDVRYCAVIASGFDERNGRPQAANYEELGLTPILCVREQDIGKLPKVESVVFFVTKRYAVNSTQFQGAMLEAFKKLKGVPRWLFNPDQAEIPLGMIGLTSLPLGPPGLVERGGGDVATT